MIISPARPTHQCSSSSTNLTSTTHLEIILDVIEIVAFQREVAAVDVDAAQRVGDAFVPEVGLQKLLLRGGVELVEVVGSSFSKCAAETDNFLQNKNEDNQEASTSVTPLSNRLKLHPPGKSARC